MQLLICADGTGGGVYPALSVLQVMMGKGTVKAGSGDMMHIQDQPLDDVLWVGGEGGMEEDLVQRTGVKYETIPAAGLHGVGMRSLPGNMWKQIKGWQHSRTIIRNFHPDVMLLTGGYMAVPMAIAGRLSGSKRPNILLYVPEIEPGLALKTLARFADRIALTAEESRKYFGFVHPYVMDAGVETTSVKLLVRDFATAKLGEMEQLVGRLAQVAATAYPGARAEVRVEQSYRNMKEVLDHHPDVVENACAAFRPADLEPRIEPIRGGTDGSRLSFMGLPTPNIFAGENNYHSRLEWVSAQDMEKAVEVIVHLCQVWEERA